MVCVPELVLNKTRQDETGRQFPNLLVIGTRLLLYGPVAWENLGKIREINGTGRDRTSQYHSGKSRVVPNFETFPGKPLKTVTLRTFLVVGTINITYLGTNSVPLPNKDRKFAQILVKFLKQLIYHILAEKE